MIRENCTVSSPSGTFTNHEGGTIEIRVGPHATLNVVNDWTNEGDIMMFASGGWDARLSQGAGSTLTHTGTMTTMSGNSALNIENAHLNIDGGMIEANSNRTIDLPGGSMAISNGTLALLNGDIGCTAEVINAATGTIDAQRSMSISTPGAEHENSGVIQVSSGQTLSFGGSSLTNQSGGTILGNGTLNVSGVSFEDNGITSPGVSPGTLMINGQDPRSATSVRDIEIGGPNPGSQHDQLNITSQAEIDGTLNITLIDGFEPTEGQTFIIMTFGSRTGTFDVVNGAAGLPGGLAFEVVYSDTNVMLNTIVE